MVTSTTKYYFSQYLNNLWFYEFILNLSGSWMFTRNNTESIGEVLTRKEDCSVILHVEKQGESIAFKYNNMGFFTTSEGKTPPIYYYHFI